MSNLLVLDLLLLWELSLDPFDRVAFCKLDGVRVKWVIVVFPLLIVCLNLFSVGMRMASSVYSRDFRWLS